VSDSVDITGVRVLGGFVLELTWADGAVTTVDAEPYLWEPVFEPLRDPAVFATVTVEPEAGTLVWPKGADISPEELRRNSRPVARAYPNARVDGYDIDEPSIEQARRNAAEAGVANRIHFQVADVGNSAAPTAPGSTTSRSPWSACTTCPTRSPCWPRCGGWLGRTAPSWS
jgi:hypothetical protein